MRLKKYIAAISLTFFGFFHSFGCISTSGGPYATNPFSIVRPLNADVWGNGNGMEETAAFWERYTDGKVTEGSIRSFFNNATADSIGHGAGSFIKYLRDADDSEALRYIGYCLEFNRLLDEYRNSLWDYRKPSTDGFKKLLASVDREKPDATFAPRYDFLKMRIYAAMKDDDKITKLWTDRGTKMQPSPLRDRMEGYYGGALYRQQKYPEALDCFFRLGDNNSVMWCVDKLAGADNLRKLYEHNPESTAIQYILQDYINYLIAATDAGRKKYDPEAEGNYDPADPVLREMRGLPVYDVERQRAAFISLCDKALAENKTDVPMMWATAKGILQCVGGEPKDGLSSFQKAASLKGTPNMRSALDSFTLWALLLNSGKGDASADKRFANSLEKAYAGLRSECENLLHSYDTDIRDDNDSDCSFAGSSRNVDSVCGYDFFTTFFANEAIAHYFDLGMPDRALAMMCLADALPISPDYSGYQSLFRYQIDKRLGTPDAESFLKYTDGKSDNPIDNLLRPYAADYRNLALDALGTRLMREGRFDDALACLSEVDPKWNITQAIYPYLRRGPGYFNPYSYSFSRTNFSGNWSPYGPYNYKAAFCADLIKAQKEYRKLSGDDRARKALELAARCHYASPSGDGWALSEYSWSTGKPYNEFSAMAKEWIGEALAGAEKPETKCMAYYALLQLPVNPDGDTAIGATGDRDRPDYYWNSPTAMQKEAMEYIGRHPEIVREVYYMSRCDVLKSYNAGNFVSRPSYL